jgi:redox-sensitive bicupin YhaK (pirin superfamily)
MKKIKTINKIVDSLPSRVGSMKIDQALPTREVSHIDPFLLIHHAKFSVPKDTKQQDAGVGPHPHKGFSPVTFVFEGSVHHRDSKGNDAVVHAGGTQWMHSGNGIIHSERPDKGLSLEGGDCEFIQFWVNSHSSDKKKDAFYKPISKDDIPTIIKDKLVISVDAGEYEDKKGPAPILSPQKLLRLEMKPKANFNLDIPKTYNCLIYLLNGEIKINDKLINARQIVQFNNDGTNIEIKSMQNSRAILLSGEPIGESTVFHGPFVMNTEDEIIEAINDSQTKKMGVLIENF